MKKILATLLGACLAPLLFSQIQAQSPVAVVRLAPPQKLAKNADEFARAVAPEASAQNQMLIAVMLAQFGYPFFDGVDSSENVLIGIFDNGAQKPHTILAAKADPKTAAICKSLAQTQNTAKNGWFFANLGAPIGDAEFGAMADALLAESAQKSSADASVEIRADKMKFYHFPNLPDTPQALQLKQAAASIEKILSECQSFRIDANLNARKLELCAAAFAKPGSRLAKLFGSYPKRAKVRGLGAISPDALLTIIGSANSAAVSDLSIDMALETISAFVKLDAGQIELAREISKNSSETFAAAISIPSNAEIPEFVTVSQTSCSAEKIAEYFASLSGMKINSFDAEGNPLEIKLSSAIKKTDIGGIDAYENRISLSSTDDAQTSFFCVKDGLLVQSGSAQSLKAAVENLSKPNPMLAKYAKSDNDITALANVRQLFKLLSNGTDIADLKDIPGFVKFKRDAATFRTEIDTKTIALLVKFATEAAAKNAGAAPAQNSN